MSRRSPLLGLAALSLPTLLLAIDIPVLAVALPSMARDLDATAPELLWMVDAYGFMVAGAMLTMGAVADRYGRRKVLLVCSAVFAFASALGAFAPTALAVILARGLMGLAGAAIMPTSMALLGTMFTEDKARLQAMGAYMTVFLLGMAVAPLVGGVLLAHWWWGSVFLMGVPVMLLTLVVVPRLVPESRSEESAPIDLLSAALSLGAVLSLVWAIKAAVDRGPTPGVGIAAIGGVLLGTVFLRRQAAAAHPLLDLALLRSGPVRTLVLALFLTALLMGGQSLFFNLYLQEVQGLTPLGAAWWMVPQMVAMVAAANIGPLLTRWRTRAEVTVAMLVVMALGFGTYVLVPVGDGGLVTLAVGSSLATFGVGALFPLLMDAAITAAPPERAGGGAAMAQLSNELGIAMGLTLLGSLGTIVYRARLDLPGSEAETNVVAGVQAAGGDAALLDAVRAAFTDAFHGVAAVGVVVLVVLAVLVARTERRLPDHAPEPAAAGLAPEA